MKNQVNDLNVVILPDKKVNDKVISWSQNLKKKYDARFALDGENYYPHITIYQTRYPKKNFEKIRSTLIFLLQTVPAFTVRMSGIDTFLEFIFYETIRDQKLMEFHLKILESLNSLREGLILPEHEAMLYNPLVSEERKSSVKKYGQRSCVYVSGS